jgi:hypothetical protein
MSSKQTRIESGSHSGGFLIVPRILLGILGMFLITLYIYILLLTTCRLLDITSSFFNEAYKMCIPVNIASTFVLISIAPLRKRQTFRSFLIMFVNELHHQR